MPQAVVDPEEVRQFARGLKKFTTELRHRLTVFVGLSVVCAVQFFNAEGIREMILWAGAFGFSLLAVMANKIWYWMELNKNAIKREIKRLELQIARLAGRLPG